MEECLDQDTLGGDSNTMLCELEDLKDTTVLTSEDGAIHKNRSELLWWCWRTMKKVYNIYLKQELKNLFKLSIPISLSLLFEFSLLWISILFLGHLPTKEDTSYQYSAAGLGASFLNVTGLSIGHGVATAADTLCSQAYGYKNYKRVGMILQRGILIMSLFMFPIWTFWLNTESILLIFHQSPCVAKFSAFYVQLFSLALPFLFMFILLQHYLQAQSIVWQFVLIGFISNCVSVILHAILIYGAGMGFTGAVIALVISNILPSVLVIAYIKCWKLHKETWGGWSFESLEEWWLFIKLAIPGLLSTILEFWGFESVNFIAGALSETDLAANVVWFQLLVIIYVPCIGISIATSVRVGNELGAGNPKGAKRASYASMTIVFILAVCFSITLLSTKNVVALIFVKGNEEIVKKVSNLMYLASIFVFTDQLQIVIGGVFRGSGRQYIGAIVSFIAYYIIGLPLGILLGFKTNLGLLGVWLGMLLGNITHFIIFMVMFIRTDWKKQAEKAMKRAQGTSSKNDNDIEVDGESENGPIQKDENSVSDSSSTSSCDTNLLCSEDIENLLSDAGLDVIQGSEEAPKSMVTTSRKLSYRVKKLLIHGSFFAIGISLVIAGGVSSRFHPHVDPEEYSNCTYMSMSNASIMDYRIDYLTNDTSMNFIES